MQRQLSSQTDPFDEVRRVRETFRADEMPCSIPHLSDTSSLNTHDAFSIITPVTAGDGALFVSTETHIEPGRLLDEYELVYVRKGVLRVEEKTNTFDVGPGQSAIFAPGVYHRRYVVNGEPLQQYWVRFTPHKSAGRTGDNCTIVPKLATVARPSRMLQIWRMYTDEKRVGNLAQATTDMLVTLLLHEVACSDHMDLGNTSTFDALASQAKLYIQEHFSEPISTSSIASALDCNPNYLGRAFHKACGKTISTYICDIRMFYACELLAYGRKSINEISRFCGFENRCYFGAVFVKREGMSPLAYRKRYGKHITSL